MLYIRKLFQSIIFKLNKITIKHFNFKRKLKSKALLFIKLRQFFYSSGKFSKYFLKITTKSLRILRFRYIHFRHNIRSRLKLRKNQIAIRFLLQQLNLKV